MAADDRATSGGQTFSTTRRVEFRDTDAAGIAHFSTYFAWMEQAEHELLRHLGLSVFDPQSSGTVTWPRVSAQADFLSAVRFEDVVDIAVRVVRLGEKSATFGFEFSLAGRPVARGTITTVCCRFTPHGATQSLPIPAEIRRKLAEYAGRDAGA